ncbi:MAG: DUF2470 domain-containing protein [Bacteroidota bacterium]
MPFNQKYKDYAINHMNEDHRDAMVEMLQGFCQANWVTDAEMLDFDAQQMQIRGLDAVKQSEDFTLLFDTPLADAKEFRPTLMALLSKARALKNTKNDSPTT